jgi:hypothetical protein
MYFATRATAVAITALFGLAICSNASAKPIAFKDATTVMYERDANMTQTEIYYAPEYWWSVGFNNATMRSDRNPHEMRMQHLQANVLLKRWNLPGAQGNLFASAGYGFANNTLYPVAGVAHPGHSSGQIAQFTESARRLGLQGDYETRQFYSSFKIDIHRSQTYADRTNVVQLGFSPYPHDYDDLAVWLVGQVKRYSGSMNNKTESGVFVRLFKRNVWVEIGMDENRRSNIMLMVNY